LKNNKSLYMRVLHACAAKGAMRYRFRDDDLAHATGIPRNITARIRLDLERDGWIERVPGNGKLMFVMPTEMIEAYEMKTRAEERK
jgi:DNA-binding IscR family transcriptional regulator